MLLKNSEFPLKVKFSDETFQNIFVGVAGDNKSRILEVTILDLNNNIYTEDIPSFKILAKGDLDKKVYYNAGTKKTAGVYTVEIPSQVFKQSQNVEIQFLIENEETHERIFSPMIKQKVQRGFCANFEEGTNIYIDYDEIKEFETKFPIFLNQVEETKNEIDENFKGAESKINNLEELMLEEVEKAVENITADVQVDLNVEKDKIILEMSGVGDSFKAELKTLKIGALEEVEEGVEKIKTDTAEEIAAISENTINLITSEQTQSIAKIKEASNTSLAEIKKQSEAEIKVIKETREISVAALDSKKVTCIQEIETATSEAVKTIDDKIAELDPEGIMQKLNELETLITGFDDRIKANADAITGHSEEIKSINDNVLVHQTDIDTVTDDLNKKI